jgi:hypothetical protein
MVSGVPIMYKPTIFKLLRKYSENIDTSLNKNTIRNDKQADFFEEEIRTGSKRCAKMI